MRTPGFVKTAAIAFSVAAGAEGCATVQCDAYNRCTQVGVGVTVGPGAYYGQPYYPAYSGYGYDYQYVTPAPVYVAPRPVYMPPYRGHGGYGGGFHRGWRR